MTELTWNAPGGVSPTLAANLTASRMRAEGHEILHMGFGEAPFPVHPRLARALGESAGERGYLPVAGLPELRRAATEHQARVAALDGDAFEVMVAPGSKAMLFALQLAVPGDTVLPTPSWVSYRPQAEVLGLGVVPVASVLDERGYRIEPEALDRAVVEARKAGRQPTKVVLNSPSNPTGLVMPDDNAREIAEVCRRHGLIVVSDEIYARLTFDGSYPSIARHAPERTVVTTGLSKHMSLGGWRVGLGFVPKALEGLFAALETIASETWSCVASPVQFAAIEAYSGHEDVEAFIALSRRIHADVTGYAAARLNAMDVPTVTPQGGFYLWPDVPRRGRAHNLGTSNALADALLEGVGVLTLPGTAFGERPEAMRLRLSACDYDGAAALDHYRALADGTKAEIGAFAPRVVAAMDAFERFLGGA